MADSSEEYSPRYFFDEGIRFACRRCGLCCSGEPGVVHATSEELRRIADFLLISFNQFVQDFCTAYESGCRLNEHPDGRCVFFNNGCSIYSVRPEQCKTFPFWVSALRSEERWSATCKRCPGIGEGMLYTQEEILERMWQANSSAMPPAPAC